MLPYRRGCSRAVWDVREERSKVDMVLHYEDTISKSNKGKWNSIVFLIVPILSQFVFACYRLFSLLSQILLLVAVIAFLIQLPTSLKGKASFRLSVMDRLLVKDMGENTQQSTV
jgi:hypothetical protein